jgi:branched-chain amino acid transport system ATP-binding protein
MSNGEPILAVQGLRKVFGGLVAVSDFMISVPKGQIKGLIGPNGAGKTTVFHMLTGVLKPTSGQVMFSGKDITNLTSHEIARLGIARTYQKIRILHNLTVLDNMRYALVKDTRYTVFDMLISSPRYRREESRITSLAESMLDALGILSLRDHIASDLAYGQQRRLSIARALVVEPDLLLLDEPTAGLNSKEANEIADLIYKVRDEMELTIILVEHNMRVIMNICDDITVLDEGNIICKGTPTAVQNDEQVIRAYLGVEDEL